MNMKRTGPAHRLASAIAALVMALTAAGGSILPATAETDKETGEKVSRELYAAYDKGYREKYAEWTPEAVLMKIAGGGDDDQSRERFEKTSGMVNDLYQSANSAHPILKYVVSGAVGFEYGALSGIGTGLFLSDTGLGSALRESAGTLLAVGEALADAYWRSKQSNMNSTDLEPVRSENGFTLLRTHGSLGSILNETGGMPAAQQALAMLEKELENHIPTDKVKVEYLMGKFDPTDPREMEKAVWGQEVSGQSRAISDRMREWENLVLFSLYAGTSTFTINGKPVLSMDWVDRAAEALTGTISLSEEELQNIRAGGPGVMKRLILKKGTGLTDEEIDGLRNEHMPSVRVTPADYASYIKNLKKNAEAAGEDGARYDAMIAALEIISEEQGAGWNSLSYTGGGNLYQPDLSTPGAEQDYIYLLLDGDHNVAAQFLCPIGDVFATIGPDGSMVLAPVERKTQGPDYESEDYMILDAAGHVLYRNQISGEKAKLGTVIWYDMTPSGNMLRKTYTSSVQYGDHELLELVRPDGTTEEIFRGQNIRRELNGRYFTDLIPFSYQTEEDGRTKFHDAVVNAGTGEVTEGSTEIPEEKQEEDEFSDPRAEIDDRFILTQDKLVYREDGKLFCDFSSLGGIKQIRQIGDLFWILNNTGYFYVMDMDLTIQSDDYIRLDPDAYYKLNEYGLFETVFVQQKNYSTSASTRRIAADGSITAEYPLVKTSDIHDFWIGNPKNGYYDLASGQRLCLGEIRGNFDQIAQRQVYRYGGAVFYDAEEYAEYIDGLKAMEEYDPALDGR